MILGSYIERRRCSFPMGARQNGSHKKGWCEERPLCYQRGHVQRTRHQHSQAHPWRVFPEVCPSGAHRDANICREGDSGNSSCECWHQAQPSHLGQGNKDCSILYPCVVVQDTKRDEDSPDLLYELVTFVLLAFDWLSGNEGGVLQSIHGLSTSENRPLLLSASGGACSLQLCSISPIPACVFLRAALPLSLYLLFLEDHQPLRLQPTPKSNLSAMCYLSLLEAFWLGQPSLLHPWLSPPWPQLPLHVTSVLCVATVSDFHCFCSTPSTSLPHCRLGSCQLSLLHFMFSYFKEVKDLPYWKG